MIEILKEKNEKYPNAVEDKTKNNLKEINKTLKERKEIKKKNNQTGEENG